MCYKIYKLNLTNGKIEKSIKEFSEKHDSIMYCHMMNSVEPDFGSTYYYFYFEIGNRDFDEFVKEADILNEAKKQISGRMHLIKNEKNILDRAEEALSNMEKKEAV